METPDVIKKTMEHCAGSRPCAECAYDNRDFPYCIMRQRTDALAYIQHLEAERDAAVALVPRACAHCKWYGTKHGGFHPDCKNPNGCRNVSGINTGWQWRGVQREE